MSADIVYHLMSNAPALHTLSAFHYGFPLKILLQKVRHVSYSREGELGATPAATIHLELEFPTPPLQIVSSSGRKTKIRPNVPASETLVVFRCFDSKIEYHEYQTSPPGSVQPFRSFKLEMLSLNPVSS